MSSTLTDRQQNVYDMIRGLIVTRGYGPTVREIGEHFGIKSPNGVMCHLRALERKGLITRSPNKSRAIELTHAADRNGNAMPMTGMIATAPTMLDFEDNERVDFSEMLYSENRFILRVSGDSMIDAHIADGDYVVVERKGTAEPGQLVVVETDDSGATLRYWHPEEGRIRLEAANRSVEPIYVSEATIIGVAVSAVRSVLTSAN